MADAVASPIMDVLAQLPVGVRLLYTGPRYQVFDRPLPQLVERTLLQDFEEYFNQTQEFQAQGPNPYLPAGRQVRALDCLFQWAGSQQQNADELMLTRVCWQPAVPCRWSFLSQVATSVASWVTCTTPAAACSWSSPHHQLSLPPRWVAGRQAAE